MGKPKKNRVNLGLKMGETHVKMGETHVKIGETHVIFYVSFSLDRE